MSTHFYSPPDPDLDTSEDDVIRDELRGQTAWERWRGWSPWSRIEPPEYFNHEQDTDKEPHMNTAVTNEVLVPGAAIGGGFFAGRFFIGAQAYGLIVSPRADGDLEDRKWGPARKNIAGALSYNDGRANTLAMAEAGSKLAQEILALRIGDCDDWYLMSRQEALMAYHELRQVKAFEEGETEAFEPEAYWTSTQHAFSGGYAWCQYFTGGYQSNGLKDYSFRARAVRRMPL